VRVSGELAKVALVSPTLRALASPIRSKGAQSPDQGSPPPPPPAQAACYFARHDCMLTRLPFPANGTVAHPPRGKGTTIGCDRRVMGSWPVLRAVAHHPKNLPSATPARASSHPAETRSVPHARVVQGEQMQI
jgi:hypothetical protein